MNAYLLFKSLHLISVISWMAGLLYLPRIFVYHAEKLKDTTTSNTFKIMERKLYNYIMTPSMILAWIFGIILITKLNYGGVIEFWLQIKLCLVVLLTIYHFYLGSCVGKFANDQNTNSSKFYRIINEAPTILLIIIVFVVIFKPL